MIFDELKNKEQYFCLGQNFKKAFNWLCETDLKNLADGKYNLDDDKIFANVQSLKTKSKEEKKWEAHRKYIDIQYIIKGEETMGYGILDDFSKVILPYDNKKDIEFLDGEKFNYINLKEGEFVIFYPNDVHAPMLYDKNAQDIKKVIVKISY